jgi:hypothetical protein
MEPAPEQGEFDQPFRLGTGVALESGWNPEAGSAAQRAAAEAHFKVKVASADSHVAALWTDNAWTEFEQARMTLKHFDVLKRNTTNTKMQAVVNFSTIWFVFEQDRYSESTSEDMSGSITRHFIVAGYISRTQRLVRAAFGDGEDDDIALMEVEDQGPGHITYTYLSSSKKNSRGYTRYNLLIAPENARINVDAGRSSTQQGRAKMEAQTAEVRRWLASTPDLAVAFARLDVNGDGRVSPAILGAIHVECCY